jgi:hypothetical protein
MIIACRDVQLLPAIYTSPVDLTETMILSWVALTLVDPPSLAGAGMLLLVCICVEEYAERS